MAARGNRLPLRPILYVGLASLLHGLLFLIPAVPIKGGSQTVRGVRVHPIADVPTRGGGNPRGMPIPEPRDPRLAPRLPEDARPDPASPSGKAINNLPPLGIGEGTTPGPGGRPAGTGVPFGDEKGEGTGIPENLGPRGPGSAFEEFMQRLRSKETQQWAKETTERMRHEWKGAATKAAERREPSKRDAAVASDPSATGGPRNLDPRVRMVVTSYPPTSIERRYTGVPYPDVKIKKHQYTSGWWNVYIQIMTDREGRILKCDVLRPETTGTLETVFVEQVKREVARWTFDPVPAEILVDVRFHVE